MRKVTEISDTNGKEKESKVCMSSLIKRKLSVLQYFMKGAFYFSVTDYRLFETTKTWREGPDPLRFSWSVALT